MDWQQIASLLIVAAAAFWLIRTQILAARRGGGGCGGCPSSLPRPSQRSGAGHSPLIQIEVDLGVGKKERRGVDG